MSAAADVNTEEAITSRAAIPLVDGAHDAPVAWRDGRFVSRGELLATAAAHARLLPAQGAMLNLAADRYAFAVGLVAALMRGHVSLQPSNHAPHTVERLRAAWAATAPVYAWAEAGGETHDLPAVRFDAHPDATSAAAAGPGLPTAVAASHVAAQVLTSGSTGDPTPHAKPWGLLALSARVESMRLGAYLSRPSLDGVTLVATVPPQHMYGFESSVLVALHGGAVLDAGRPFYPADVAAALAAAPRPRGLVTTPFHLKALVDGRVAMPPVDFVLCATAPLPPQLAAAAEAAFEAPLVEIYGCTEAGQVATRRTTEGPEWHVFDGMRLSGDGESSVVEGGPVPQPTPLADILEVVDAQHFRLLGRSNDLVNIAGKRSSLGHLNFHLNAIDGVADGAFWMPPDDAADAAGIARLVVFVAGRADDAAILAALRQRVDAAFLPRRIVRVERLPREATGKLTSTRLGELARELGVAGRRGAGA